jgi:hypothetical protein
MIFLSISCSKDEIHFDKNHPIIGNWEFVISSEETTYTLYHMKRTADLSYKFGSVAFGAEGVFKKIDSWGFSGQPTTFGGTWAAQNDSLILVEMTQPFQETWKMVIKKLNKESMEFYYLFGN